MLIEAGRYTALAAGLLVISVTSFAVPSDRNQPISLEADQATFNQKTGLTTYKGNVVVIQGTAKIQADSVVATLNKDRQIQQVTAQGKPAKFQQQISEDKGIARGEGQTIVYNAQSGIITLSGNAYLTQDGASFRGNTLRYNVNAGDVDAAGTAQRRVQLIIPPSAFQTDDSADDSDNSDTASNIKVRASDKTATNKTSAVKATTDKTQSDKAKSKK